MRTSRSALVLLLFALFAFAPGAQAAEKGAKAKEFAARFAALKKDNAAIVVKMTATDDPAAVPESASGGHTLVAAGRMGIYTPNLLSSEDMLSVVNQNMVSIRRCYKKQLEADGDWQGEMILDLAVKKTGRISEVEISPGRVQRDVIGQCLLSEIPKWKFPEFTGEIDDGVLQEVVNGSVPLAFSAK